MWLLAHALPAFLQSVQFSLCAGEQHAGAAGFTELVICGALPVLMECFEVSWAAGEGHAGAAGGGHPE